MKHTQPTFSPELLRFIRDNGPTEEAVVEWLGDPREAAQYHLLRKSGYVDVHDGRVCLSAQYLSADGEVFTVGSERVSVNIDDGTITRYTVCGPFNCTHDRSE